MNQKFNIRKRQIYYSLSTEISHGSETRARVIKSHGFSILIKNTTHPFYRTSPPSYWADEIGDKVDEVELEERRGGSESRLTRASVPSGSPKTETYLLV